MPGRLDTIVEGGVQTWKKMAIVPWGEVFLKDKIFDLSSCLNRDNTLLTYKKLRDYFNSRGWEVHTIDCYSNLESIDFFVFFTFYEKWYKRIYDMHLESKAIYVAFEPPVVDQNHSEKGIKKLLKYFQFVLVWNDDLVDNKRVLKYVPPYFFCPDCFGNDFDKKKLLVNISGNKSSKVCGELYSERERIITYFDDSDDFELYGVGWDAKTHPSYRGVADSKFEIYHKFKFAICLENMKNVKGYISEKILDCLCAGVVPIYMGASNIDEYIPENCFIPYEMFGSLEELKNFLKEMDEKKYDEYIIAAKKYLDGDAKHIFDPVEFGKCLLDMYEKLSGRFRAKRTFYLDYVIKIIWIVIRKTKSIFTT